MGKAMDRRYTTVDVFTEHMFGGNPLAVVLDAQSLSPIQMQAIAAEFNYAETTFVLPPRDPKHTAQVRIFTPRSEVPFAGHPNVGTAYVLARAMAAAGQKLPERFDFEEIAGIVAVRILREGEKVTGAELTAPEPLSRGAEVTAQIAAACLSLPAAEIRAAVHAPQVVSVGLPFLVAELATRAALTRSRPDAAAHEKYLPGIGVDAIFAYVRERDDAGTGVLHARMYAPLDGIPEDPATGSATAATLALLTDLAPEGDIECRWRVHQGDDMGRPSILLGATAKRAGALMYVRVGGRCAPVMTGTLNVGA
jgi:trans-2,3-dihydro-3-hydroxyanthranilate isomerase